MNHNSHNPRCDHLNVVITSFSYLRVFRFKNNTAMNNRAIFTNCSNLKELNKLSLNQAPLNYLYNITVCIVGGKKFGDQSVGRWLRKYC